MLNRRFPLGFDVFSLGTLGVAAIVCAVLGFESLSADRGEPPPPITLRSILVGTDNALYGALHRTQGDFLSAPEDVSDETTAAPSIQSIVDFCNVIITRMAQARSSPDFTAIDEILLATAEDTCNRASSASASEDQVNWRKQIAEMMQPLKNALANASAAPTKPYRRLFTFRPPTQ